MVVFLKTGSHRKEGKKDENTKKKGSPDPESNQGLFGSN